MKKVFYFLLVAMFCSAFVGCSKNDAGEISKDNYEDAIVGEWSNYKDEENGEFEYWEEDEYGVIFRANGTGCWLYYGERDEGFEWEIEGSYLYLYYPEYGDEDMAKIKTLTKTEMVLSYDDGEWLEYYKRAN